MWCRRFRSEGMFEQWGRMCGNLHYFALSPDNWVIQKIEFDTYEGVWRLSHEISGELLEKHVFHTWGSIWVPDFLYSLSLNILSRQLPKTALQNLMSSVVVHSIVAFAGVSNHQKIFYPSFSRVCGQLKVIHPSCQEWKPFLCMNASYIWQNVHQPSHQTFYYLINFFYPKLTHDVMWSSTLRRVSRLFFCIIVQLTTNNPLLTRKRRIASSTLSPSQWSYKAIDSGQANSVEKSPIVSLPPMAIYVSNTDRSGGGRAGLERNLMEKHYYFGGGRVELDSGALLSTNLRFPRPSLIWRGG